MDKINKSEYEEALKYHNHDRPGKISITPTKPLVTSRDLSLAYSPGVAWPCLEIANNINDIYKYTARGNLVAVISNGTAVLGLGNLGAAASKPVMEGKAVLFKNFADIDAIDIEIDTTNPQEFINAVKYLGYSFGGINLEDIKAPECFFIEEELQKHMQIPVFHDDQHGTAIITAAGLINAAHITNRTFDTMKIVVNGAGSAAIACITLLIALGAQKGNIILCDTRGVIYRGRKEGMNQWKEDYASDTNARNLKDAICNADVFLGLSVAGVVSKDMVASMAANPIVFAMANPDPEITPEDILDVRKDAIIATGRSDYNNQVNNVMGFPYIFRGALDVRATTINQEMKIAASRALADLARHPVPNEVYKAYPGRKMSFGPEYIIPVPFDPRLISTIPIAVAKAAIESGVAKITDMDYKTYKIQLESRLNPTSTYMNFLFERVRANPQRIVFAEGEEEEAIKAAIMVRDDNLGYPILVGRAHKIQKTLSNIGIYNNLENITIMNAAVNPNIDKYIDILYNKLQRKGYLYRDCGRLVKTDRNIFAACMVAYNDADAMITGLNKSYLNNFEDISKVIDKKTNHIALSYSIMISKEHNILIADNTVHETPTAPELAQITIQMAKIARSIGYEPRVALLSFSNFGDSMQEDGCRIKEAVKILDEMNLDFEYDGELSADVALNKTLHKIYPFCRLSGPANVLIMPNLNSASIATKLLQELSTNVFLGPILNGFEHSIQILQMGSSATQILKSAAFAAMDAINNKT